MSREDGGFLRRLTKRRREPEERAPSLFTSSQLPPGSHGPAATTTPAPPGGGREDWGAPDTWDLPADDAPPAASSYEAPAPRAPIAYSGDRYMPTPVPRPVDLPHRPATHHVEAAPPTPFAERVPTAHHEAPPARVDPPGYAPPSPPPPAPETRITHADAVFEPPPPVAEPPAPPFESSEPIFAPPTLDVPVSVRPAEPDPAAVPDDDDLSADDLASYLSEDGDLDADADPSETDRALAEATAALASMHVDDLEEPQFEEPQFEEPRLEVAPDPVPVVTIGGDVVIRARPDVEAHPRPRPTEDDTRGLERRRLGVTVRDSNLAPGTDRVEFSPSEAMALATRGRRAVPRLRDRDRDRDRDVS